MPKFVKSIDFSGYSKSFSAITTGSITPFKVPIKRLLLVEVV